jgi:predicted secreted protein
MRYVSFAAIAALCLALSCAAPAASPGQPANAEMEAFIGNAIVLSPDVPATVMLGGEFAIVLKENPSAGYQWSYSIMPAELARETAKESFSTATKPMMVGAPVFTVWKFRADAGGEAVFTYLYYRPWEKPETAVERKVFKVTIVR